MRKRRPGGCRRGEHGADESFRLRVLIVMIALLFVPRLLKRLHMRSADPELQTISVAGVLFPLALGSSEQLAAARADLTRRGASDAEVAAFADARLETVIVPPNPSVVGAALWTLRIPNRTGAVVAGIGRNGTRQSNPHGDEVLQAGDELLVIGASGELRALDAAVPSRRGERHLRFLRTR